jgi:hypothetical protein
MSLLAESLSALIVGEIRGAGDINVLRREHKNRLPNIRSIVNSFWAVKMQENCFCPALLNASKPR